MAGVECDDVAGPAGERTCNLDATADATRTDRAFHDFLDALEHLPGADRSPAPRSQERAERVLPEVHRAVEDLGDVVLGDVTG
jgi:hypothetical protein